MTEITYPQMLVFITAVWIVVRVLVGLKRRAVDWAAEARLLLVYVCIIVIARIVYFPMHHVDGHIGTLKFDAERMLPFRVNLIPIKHLFYAYSGWKINLIGNIAMFVPVGLVLPFCFQKLNNVGKVTLAGAGLSLLIELTQLPFYERHSDVDDLLLNTTGALLGAIVYFAVSAASEKRRRKRRTHG